MAEIILIISVVAILVFIYLTRSINQKREERRMDRQAKRQEMFERTLEQVKKSDHDAQVEKQADD